MRMLHQLPKTWILTSCNYTCIIPTLTLHHPDLAADLQLTINSYSNAIDKTSGTIIGGELTDGFCLLGIPVGFTKFIN